MEQKISYVNFQLELLTKECLLKVSYKHLGINETLSLLVIVCRALTIFPCHTYSAWWSDSYTQPAARSIP